MNGDGLDPLETCSICCELTEWATMRQTDAGIICKDCWKELRNDD